MRTKQFAMSFAAGLLCASASFADNVETYKIDPIHSSVQFRIRHLFSKVTGRFNDFSGTIVANGTDPTQSTVEATIKTATVDTKNEKRDTHLRSADFFDVEKYPAMTFKSTSWKKLGKDEYEVAGDLTLHGITKPVKLAVKSMGAGPDAMGGYRSGWEATTTLDRTAFGVSWNKAVEGGGLMLGNEVEVSLEIEAVRQPPGPAPK